LTQHHDKRKKRSNLKKLKSSNQKQSPIRGERVVAIVEEGMENESENYDMQGT
jgi:hypothetical protein